MWSWVGAVGGSTLLLVVAVLGLQLVSFRIGWEPGVTAIRRFNRRFMNPRQMRTAGQPGAYAGIIRHVGRKSGTRYETPVGVVDTDDALSVVLPYGTSADWVRNVLAAGEAEVVHEGRTWQVTEPELVDGAEAAARTTGGDRFLQRLYGVDQALRLRKTEARVR